MLNCGCWVKKQNKNTIIFQLDQLTLDNYLGHNVL